jgi:hypothetical protein
MAKAHKCAISGKLEEGEGVQVVLVDITKTLRAELRFFEKEGGAYRQSTICKDEVPKLEQAIKAAVGIVPETETK